MKAHTLLLSAALALASAAVSSAQVTTTFETMSAWTGARSSVQDNTAIAQTMKLPAASAAIYSMTWRFTTPTSVTTSSLLEAYFVEWNTSLVAPVAGAPIWSDLAVVLPAYGSGNYDLTLTPNLLTDSTKTYAMILRGVSMDSNVQVANVDSSNAFPYGRNYRNPDEATSYAVLSTLEYANPGYDWGFSQIVIADSVLTPIPETGTVAVIFAGALVAGLGFRRRYSAKREAGVDQTGLAA